MGEFISTALSRDFSLSRSSFPGESLKSVARRSRAGGGVAAWLSSRGNRAVPIGVVNPPLAMLSPVVSRRLFAGRCVFRELSPNGAVFCDCEIDDLRIIGPSLAAPSLLAFWDGSFSGELTVVEKFYLHQLLIAGNLAWGEPTSFSSSVKSTSPRGCELPSRFQHISADG